MKSLIRQSPILKGIILITFLVGLIFGIIAIGIVYHFGYQQQISEISRQIKLLSESQKQVIANAVWDFDTDSIQLYLDGLLSHPDIKYVKLDLQTEHHSAGNADAIPDSHLHDTFRIGYKSSGVYNHLGILHVYASLDQVKIKAVEGFISAVVSMGVVLLIICILLYTLLYYKFYRHLRHIVTFTNNLDIKNLHEQLRLDRESDEAKRDELSLIVQVINDLRLRLKEGIEESQHLEEDRYILEMAIEQFGDAILITNQNWTVRYANSALLRRSKCTSKDVLGKDLLTFLALPQHVLPYKSILKRIRRGKSWSTHLRRKSGEGPGFIEEDLKITAITPEFQNDLFFMVKIKDVTKELAMEKQLFQAIKMESIGTLAGGIAHDFNNLLSIILGYSDLMHLKHGKDPGIAHDIEQILKASKRAKDLVAQILAFSREAEAEIKPVNLLKVINEVQIMLKASLPSTVQLHLDLDDNCDAVNADESQMHQVIMNLCSNAKQALPRERGEITISLVQLDLYDNFTKSISGLQAGLYNRLTITDTGAGMDEVTKSRIFDPFFTTKKQGQGTGLGLSVVHGIVKKHKGEIFVESQPGIGTSFTIYLPVAESKDVTEDIESHDNLQGEEHILVVDDEEMVGEMTQDSLVCLGYSVTRFGDPLAALKHFTETPHQYDLVITDMTMPDLTGDQLAIKLLAVQPDIPIVLTTGYNENIDEKKAKQLGIADFVNKPVVAKELARIIRRILDSGNKKQQ